MNEFGKARRLWAYMGGVDDAILEEAETADIVGDTAVTRKRYVKYGTVAAATVAAATATYFLIRSRRAAASA